MDGETDRLLTSVPSSRHLHEYRSYRRRWFILAVISLINLSNGMTWNTFGPITTKTMAFYGISEDLVNMLSLIFMLCTIVIGFIAIWLLDFWGLRAGVLLGGSLNCIGNVLRVASCLMNDPQSTTAVVLLFFGQILAACAQPFVLFTPTKVSTLWFPSNERAVANMLASMSNPIGIMIVTIMASHMVTDYSLLKLLISIVAIPSIISAAMAFAGVCSSVPPTPPSGGAEEKAEPFFAGLKEVFCNKHYMILWLVFGSGAGTVTALTALLQQITCVNHYTQEFSGLCLMFMYLFGFVGAFVFSIYVDRTKQFELTAKVSSTLCALCLIFLTVFVDYPGMDVAVAIAISFLGFFGFGAYPVALELSVESTFPIAQATSAGFIIMSSQIQGSILVVMMTKVFGKNIAGECPIDFTRSTMFLSSVSVITVLIFIIFYKSANRRLEAEQRAAAESLMSGEWMGNSSVSS